MMVSDVGDAKCWVGGNERHDRKVDFGWCCGRLAPQLPHLAWPHQGN